MYSVLEEETEAQRGPVAGCSLSPSKIRKDLNPSHLFLPPGITIHTVYLNILGPRTPHHYAAAMLVTHPLTHSFPSPPSLKDRLLPTGDSVAQQNHMLSEGRSLVFTPEPSAVLRDQANVQRAAAPAPA